ncbi:MAG: hypothetical protein VR69_03975 [Peptococcaceae bacterium BRH_c4b]|nr:MAG: hypothetical protein VR69_03975 [Peptococcaceae bacterium BRH_c4b]
MHGDSFSLTRKCNMEVVKLPTQQGRYFILHLSRIGETTLLVFGENQLVVQYYFKHAAAGRCHRNIVDAKFPFNNIGQTGRSSPVTSRGAVSNRKFPIPSHFLFPFPYFLLSR